MSGFFGGLKRELDLAAKTVSREVDDVGKQLGISSKGPQVDLFKTGNVIQLVSRSSGKCLEIVMSPAGSLVVDGMGPEGPTVMHAHWTVINDGSNIVRLHNQTNFLAIREGATQVLDCPNFGLTVEETKFRLSQTGQFVTLESFKQTGKHVGVLPSGEIKSALACGKEADAHFGVRLIYAPPPPVVQATAAAPGQTVVTTTTYAQKK